MKKVFIATLALVAPVFVGAQDFSYIFTVLNSIQGLVNFMVPLLIAIALLLFIWGLLTFILNANDDTARAEGKQRMIWGVIALFVIVSVWGLVGLLNQLSGVEAGGDVAIPGVPAG